MSQGLGVNLLGWETGGDEGGSMVLLTQMAWLAGTSGDNQGIQLAEDQEKQTRLANHPDEREKPFQAK